MAISMLLLRSAALALLLLTAAAAAAVPVAPGPSAQDNPQVTKPEKSPFPDDPLALVSEGNKLKTQGKYDEAAAFYQRALRLDSRLFEAHIGLGMVRDLQGHYTDAQKELNKALAAAPENAREQRDTALAALAVSHAFQGDLEGAQRYYERLYDFQVATQRLDVAATTAQEIGRAYLDSGDTKNAAQWYQTGQEAVRKLSGLPGDQVDLWRIRWENAQSRIAARSGNREEADTHLAAMKVLIDKGELNFSEVPNYQYLVGYNAFYAGRYDEAIDALQKADAADPAVLSMIATAYAKQGDADGAKAYANKAAILPMHTLQGAMARRDLTKIDEELAKAKAAKEKAEKEKADKEKAQKETSDKEKNEKDVKGKAGKPKKEPKKEPEA
jgi:tetratricopeptide (TPR) repeat protein